MIIIIILTIIIIKKQNIQISQSKHSSYRKEKIYSNRIIDK